VDETWLKGELSPTEKQSGTLNRALVSQEKEMIDQKFGIESPNEQALRFHLKLGHLKIEGDSYVGIKCFLVPGM
jgi:hypothetical protein